MAIRVGRWDCKTCGHIGVLGPETSCPNCGSPRPENVKFYLPDDAEEVKDEKKIEQAHAGADWVCAHCTSHNKAWETSCQACGSPKETDDGDKHLEEKTEYFDKRNEPKPQPIASVPEKKKKPFLVKLFIWGILGFFAFMGLTLINADTEVTVLEHKWERKIALEEYKQVTEEGWEVPQGGQMIKSWRDIHHYDQKLIGHETKTREKRVKVGEERYVCGKIDKGNGFFQDKYCTKPIYETRTETYEDPIYEKVPVYATKYRYNIMKWVKIDPLYASQSNKTPFWPKPSSNQTGKNFRQGKKTEKYHLIIKDHEGKKHDEVVKFNFWNKVPEKGKWPATKSLVFGFYKELKENK